jgi:hypothetical protein
MQAPVDSAVTGMAGDIIGALPPCQQSRLPCALLLGASCESVSHASVPTTGSEAKQRLELCAHKRPSAFPTSLVPSYLTPSVSSKHAWCMLRPLRRTTTFARLMYTHTRAQARMCSCCSPWQQLVTSRHVRMWSAVTEIVPLSDMVC